MSTDLYEILGIQKDATDDQIRKAYRRLALQTHPDRVPPEQKLTAEDEFRKVNNAYEVLIDPTKRQAYDAAGVWPPPPPQPQSQPPQPRSRGSRHRHRPYRTSREPHVPFPEDPFDFGRHHHAGFTDPFRLFESIFDELRHAMSNPFLPDPWRRDRRHDPHQRVRDFFDASFIDMGFPFDRHGRSRRYNPHQHFDATIHTNACATSLITRSSTWASPSTVVVALTI
ncbi:DnaJ domain-containing protein [Lactifluus subvellereus]|nr:DnaJ domain-containing protein [Lactifluus subvellereus]